MLAYADKTDKEALIAVIGKALGFAVTPDDVTLGPVVATPEEKKTRVTVTAAVGSETFKNKAVVTYDRVTFGEAITNSNPDMTEQWTDYEFMTSSDVTVEEEVPATITEEQAAAYVDTFVKPYIGIKGLTYTLTILRNPYGEVSIKVTPDENYVYIGALRLNVKSKHAPVDLSKIEGVAMGNFLIKDFTSEEGK